MSTAIEPEAASKPYRLVDFAEVPGVPCPCGTARRAFADVADRALQDGLKSAEIRRWPRAASPNTVSHESPLASPGFSPLVPCAGASAPRERHRKAASPKRSRIRIAPRLSAWRTRVDEAHLSELKRVTLGFAPPE